MRREVFTDIEIQASRERLWEVITDFHAYSRWNPFVRLVSGNAAKGARLFMVLKPQGQPAVTIRPTVTVSRPSQELRWTGRFLMPGLFDHEHFFRIRQAGNRHVRFSHGGSFSGALVGFTSQATESRFKTSFVAMNNALKVHVESDGTERGYRAPSPAADPDSRLALALGPRPGYAP